jgi:hypothetical protein
MTNTRKIIRAFLASPGDLQEERKAIRAVIDEFNESWADDLGYQIELIGWEETVAGFGRPQNLINQDLDRCDLLLGMIWKRWGTPPDHGGKFSSGFQEEFERSMARREKSGSPEISLFFKKIPEEFMADPGIDLKKVLEFREAIIADKKILFQNFENVREMEILTRKCVTAYVNRVRTADEASEPEELQAKRAQSSTEKKGEDNREHKASPISDEGFKFLEDLVQKISQPDSLDALSASDVARFRLLANSVSKPGNEEMALGVHDINILFAERIQGLKLGKREIRFLARLGFQNLANENVPLWSWYSALSDSQPNPAIISSFAGTNDKEKIGALSVMTALALDLPSADDVIKREWLIDDWFSDSSSDNVRTAALRYLAKCGIAGDLSIARKEYDRNDHGTSRNALECMIEILLRIGQTKAAQELTLESQFVSLNSNLLRSVLEGFEGLETSSLLLGLEHQNSKVRLHSMMALQGRGALDIGMAERLSGDSDALVRNGAVTALLSLGKLLDETEVKNILVQPKTQTGAIGLALGDQPGEELFQKYKLDALKSLSEAELEKRVEASLMYNDTAYFALVEKDFRNHVDGLRRNVDDRFSAYFEERIKRMEVLFHNLPDQQDLIKSTRDVEEFVRKKLTRQGLNVLCAARKHEDLPRIRANLRDGYAEASRLDADYLGHHGEWIDIPLLANAKEPPRSTSLFATSGDREFQGATAQAITSIGNKHSVSDLLSIEMPATILKKTIELCTTSRFATISLDALLALFNHESDEVRKAAAVLAVQALTTKRIRSILRGYVSSDKQRYYNVIHWLDLGASMRRDCVKKVAQAVGR